MAIQKEQETGYWAAKPIPEVIYVGDINKESSPYHLHINAPLLGEMYKEELGMTSDKVARTKVAVIGKGGRDYHNPLEFFRDLPGHKMAYGTSSLFYDSQGRHRAAIYPENIIGKVKKAREALIRFSKVANSEPSILNSISESLSRQTIKSDSKMLFTTQRLMSYIKEVDQERLIKFMDRMLPSVAERFVLSVLSHEGEHVAEAWRNRFYQSKVLGFPLAVGMTAGLSANEMAKYLDFDDTVRLMFTSLTAASYTLVAYRLTGEEKRAERVVEELRSKYRWADVVTFKVNRPWDKL